MKVPMDSRANPDDAFPFSAAVIAAQFDKDRTPAAFDADGTRVRFHESWNRKTDRLVYRSTPGTDKVGFSEEARPH